MSISVVLPFLSFQQWKQSAIISGGKLIKGILNNNRQAYYINIIIIQYKVMQVNSAQIHRHSPLLFSIRYERGPSAHQ